jgi:branched-chain amino acid transport system permease protein
MIIGAIFVVFVLFVPRGLVSMPALLARWGESSDQEPPIGIEESEVDTDD